MIFTSLRILSFISIVFFSLAGCQKDSVAPVSSDPALAADSTSLKFKASGGSQQVVVTMNGKSWTAVSDQAWCLLSSTASSTKTTKVNIVANANNTTSARTATLTISMDNVKTFAISVSQAAGVEKGLYPTYSSWIAADQTGMTSNSFNIASKMIAGWNMGNSLEVPGDETGWGNAKATQTLIDSVKKAGINAIRLPCAWNSYLEDASTAKLKTSWLARVKQVVDYCYKNDMYVIINIHWDGGWLENNPTYAMQKTVNAKQKAFWEQIAMYFRDYDEHLLFAGTNEVHADGNATAENFEVQLSYNQTFVNAVRSTGGKNSWRNLIVQAYNTNIDQATTNLVMATDTVATRLLAEVHYYDPWDFCGLEADASWATAKSLWGANFAQYGTISDWGQEDYVQTQFQKMKTKFVGNGFPVILGEFGAIYRSALTGDALTHHAASRAYYFQYIAEQAKNHGMVPFYWDNGGTGSFFHRENGHIDDHQALNAFIAGATSGTYPF